VNHRIVATLIFVGCFSNSLRANIVLPTLATNLICYYDFEHPVAGNSTNEHDLGLSGTDIHLINGGTAMRVSDPAYGASRLSLQIQQINPAASGNDDWKAGIYQTNGVASLSAFSSVKGITLMGWVKPTGTNPNLHSGTPTTNDYYNAVGLFGLLRGGSEGHAVRALLEIINVSGNLRLVALGRRIDDGLSLTLATTNEWQELLPMNVWTHLAATFDFDNSTMALYRNGVPLTANYTSAGDPWGVIGGAEPDFTSATSPAGIKIGGSYPQNTAEANAFNGRFDDLMFFNKVLSAAEVGSQYSSFLNAPPILWVNQGGEQITLSWSANSAAFELEWRTNLVVGSWTTTNPARVTNGETISVTLPTSGVQQFYRLKKL
jgi:Concanavalin A-like lectin/glucanases superfamily